MKKQTKKEMLSLAKWMLEEGFKRWHGDKVIAQDALLYVGGRWEKAHVIWSHKIEDDDDEIGVTCNGKNYPGNNFGYHTDDYLLADFIEEPFDNAREVVEQMAERVSKGLLEIFPTDPVKEETEWTLAE